MSTVVHPRSPSRPSRTPAPVPARIATPAPFWRTHRVRACVTLGLVTASFIASGPVVAAAAHRPVHGLDAAPAAGQATGHAPGHGPVALTGH